MASTSLVSTRRLAATWTAAGLAAVLVSILFLDRPLADLAHTLHRPAWCVWLTWLADVPAPAALLGLLAAGMAWLCGWRPDATGRVLLAVCIATLTADAAKDLLKLGFGRTWPETWVNNPSWITNHVSGFTPFHGGAGWASFPSGHTTVITAACAVMWRHAPRLRPLWALLPVLVVVGLLGSDFHFLADCLAGALLGTAYAAAIDTLICNARPTAGTR